MLNVFIAFFVGGISATVTNFIRSKLTKKEDYGQAATVAFWIGYTAYILFTADLSKVDVSNADWSIIIVGGVLFWNTHQRITRIEERINK